MFKDFIRTARAKGLGHRAIIFRHALRNSLIPVMTVLGLQIAAELGGGRDHREHLQPARRGQLHT